MSRRPVPVLNRPQMQLEDRATRTALLGWAYPFVVTARSSSLKLRSAFGSRALLHDELWRLGSFASYQRAFAAVDRETRREFQRSFVDVPRLFARRPAPGTPELHALEAVTALMPQRIFVPFEVSWAAGFPPADALRYATRGERDREKGKKPTMEAA